MIVCLASNVFQPISSLIYMVHEDEKNSGKKEMSLFANLQEQESAQASEQRCVQLEKSRRELERQLSGLSDRLEEEEACSNQLGLHRERLETECGNLRRDLEELESALTAAERDKQVEHYGIFITGWRWRLIDGCYSDSTDRMLHVRVH